MIGICSSLRFSRYAGLLLSAVFCFFYGTATANAVNFTGTVRTGNYKQGEILVKFKPGVSTAGIKSVNSGLGARRKSTIGKTGIEIITIPANSTAEEAVAAFKNMPEVEFAQPNYRYHALATIPNDTDFIEQWGLDNIGQTVNGTTGTPDADIDAPEAWDITTGSSSVIVAVIDSGVDYNHPDLKANIWANTDETESSTDSDSNGFIDDVRGWDFVDSDNDPMDPAGHGTHVAGIIGAVGNNSIGMAGTAWTVQIMPVRVLGADGFGFTSDIIVAIDYAVNNGAKVINLSLGENPGEPPDQLMINALTRAKNAGVLAVIAAGNDANDNDALPVYPASYTLTNIISVAATNQFDNLAGFSNYGATSVDVGAPGVNTYSTIPARVTPFSDNFDDGDISDWTLGGTNNTWGLDNSLNLSGNYSLSDSPAGNYLDGADAWAQTPVIDLTGQNGCTLSFHLFGDLEKNFDFLDVFASTDGVNFNSPALDSFTGSTLGLWKQLTLDLKAYDGNSTVFLRFKLNTNGSATSSGYNLDDVSVTCSSISFTGTIYDFSGGTSFSAPYVSGLAALLLARNLSFTVSQLKDLILDNGDTASTLAGKTVSGKRINAFNSLVAAGDITPPSSPSISINSGASSTASTSVTLTLSATDDTGVTGYYLSEASTTPSASSFTSVTSTTSYSANNISFTLSSGDGAKTVYAWFRDSVGNISSRVSASINLSTPPVVPTSAPVSSGGGGGGGGGGGCFIATAAYGSYLEPNVMVLRRFRDRHLLTNSPGRLFVELYYRYSPPIADVIAGSPTLRAATRLALTPVVYGLMYPSATLFLLMISAPALAGFRFRKRPAEG